jgi:hypothetical protein
MIKILECDLNGVPRGKRLNIYTKEILHNENRITDICAIKSTLQT